jgi:hypothetical protein
MENLMTDIKATNANRKRGKRMAKGRGWRLIAPGGGEFRATLKYRAKSKGSKFALFRVLKDPNA